LSAAHRRLFGKAANASLGVSDSHVVPMVDHLACTHLACPCVGMDCFSSASAAGLECSALWFLRSSFPSIIAARSTYTSSVRPRSLHLARASAIIPTHPTHGHATGLDHLQSHQAHQDSTENRCADEPRSMKVMHATSRHGAPDQDSTLYGARRRNNP